MKNELMEEVIKVPVFTIQKCLQNIPQYSVKDIFSQCCGAGDGGAEIILGPGAGAENKF